MSEPPQAAAASGLDAWLGDPRKPPTPEAKKRRHRLHYYAFRLARHVHDADDLVQEAIARVRAGSRTWKATGTDDEKLKSMQSVIQSLHWDKIKSAPSQHERAYAAPQSKKAADGAPLALEVLITVEDAAAERAWVGRVKEQVEEKGKDPLMVQLIALSQEGTYDIDEQMAATGRSNTDVQHARKNLREWIEKLIPKDHAEKLARWRGLSKQNEDSKESPDGEEEP